MSSIYNPLAVLMDKNVLSGRENISCHGVRCFTEVRVCRLSPWNSTDTEELETWRGTDR